jgi:hypothetical protein
VPFDAQKVSLGNDREQLAKARAAAEALFKPRPQVTAEQAPMPVPDAPQSIEQHLPRAPRVFARPPAAPTRDEERPTPALPKPRATQRKGTERRMIPRSHYGRIRALAMYGMTLEQVAELYFPLRKSSGLCRQSPDPWRRYARVRECQCAATIDWPRVLKSSVPFSTN